MATIIQMPKLSDTMTVGTLVRWLKNEGDNLQSGDMIAEVETDKATMEVEIFETGTLLKCYVEPGAQVNVGTAICAIGNTGESLSQEASEPPQQTTNIPQKESPLLCPTPPQETPLPPSTKRFKASPLAKKLAQTHNTPLHLVQGTGPNGRIIKKDILSYTPPSITANTPTPTLEDKVTPVSNMRAIIAKRLLESKTQIPHFYLDIAVHTSSLNTFRESLNKHFEGRLKITVNDIILKATAIALKRVPSINSSWLGQTIQEHAAVHLSFGVAIEDGLVTPVIRNASEKSLEAISLEAKALIAKAKAKKLTPQEMSGSTFTVSNLGMFGVNTFFGIINPPNAGILTVGASLKEAIVSNDNQITIGERMHLGFSGDHRVIDGAQAAQFLKALKEILEAPHLTLL